MKELSPLQIERLKYQPKLPESLKAGINKLVCVEKEKTEAVKDKEQIIIVYCSTGGRSKDVQGVLERMGYKNVYNVYGGIVL